MAITVLIGLGVLTKRARTQDFYKSKTFIIVVGFSPAGSYDNYARAA